jgi:hypothetical protein
MQSYSTSLSKMFDLQFEQIRRLRA